ncbi:conserved hypothetical protein [Candidatus Methylobacter favarea]|uniref:Uncharacterized protein n=1 Tax=Candidatus Methylobacter favarea TaxID=2707345 RepID=A0A8S0X3C0_9GAMM|nr:hypothetical protein [Candidatus Methylobacter favarea]CAA9892614.1 conserved hypothetical protein [Candidatus Methylobacter favarea]
METFSTWESLLLGAVVLLVIFWMGPGIKASLEQSRNAKPDWPGVLVPIGLVVLFVIFLIAMV